jgi:hypothetical protein
MPASPTQWMLISVAVFLAVCVTAPNVVRAREDLALQQPTPVHGVNRAGCENELALLI